MPWVVFDIGGVMVRIRGTWGEAADAAGVQVLESVRQLRQSDFGLVDPYQAGNIDTNEFLSQLREFLGVNEDEQAISTHNAFLAEGFEGIAQLVDEMHAAGVSTGCLSNTNELHWKVLRGSGTYPAIDALRLPVASQVLGLAKPMPEIYRAFERLSGAASEDIFYFEDHPNYVSAAKSLGWNAAIIDPLNDPALQIRKSLIKRSIISS